MPQTDIKADFQSSAQLRVLTHGRGATVIPDVRSLLGSPVESYINGFQRPALRGAIREAFQQLAEDADAAKHSRTENALKLARDLQEIATAIGQIADGVRYRANTASGVMQVG